MDMQFSGISSLFQHIQRVDGDPLHVMLKQPDKSPLIAQLNSQVFSQKTLHSLLYKAFSEEPDVVTRMLDTRSYTPDTLAEIIVDALNNSEQENFVFELLKQTSSKVEVLIKALDISTGTGINWDNARSLIEKLIKLAALSVDETEQIADACPYMSEFLLPAQLIGEHSNSLLNNFLVINKTDSAEHVSQEEMNLDSSGVTEITEEASLSTIALEIQSKIGQFLIGPDPSIQIINGTQHRMGGKRTSNTLSQIFRDLLRYGQVSQDLNGAMRVALSNYTTDIEILRNPTGLIESALATLREIRDLNLQADFVTDAEMPFVGQLTNLQRLSLGYKGLGLTYAGLTHSGLKHLETLPDLLSLGLSRIKFNDTEPNYFKNLIKLQSLYLSFGSVGDSVMQSIGELTNLRILSLNQVLEKGGDQLRYLEGLTNLEKLSLPFGYSFVEAVFSLIEKLPNLRILAMYEVFFTDDQKQRLAKFPNLRVDV